MRPRIHDEFSVTHHVYEIDSFGGIQYDLGQDEHKRMVVVIRAWNKKRKTVEHAIAKGGWLICSLTRKQSNIPLSVSNSNTSVMGLPPSLLEGSSVQSRKISVEYILLLLFTY
jgi:hypothetical protein